MSRVAQWLGSTSEFRAAHREGTCRYWGAVAERAVALASLSPSWNVDDLLRDRREDVYAWLHTDEGKQLATLVPPQAARDLYRAGITLYVKPLVWLAPVAAEIARVLRVPSKFVEGGIFCNRPGAQTGMHFDRAATLCAQIRGSKTWRVAPNHQVSHPTVCWSPHSPAQREKGIYAPEPLPNEMPADAISYSLRPGALLYVPTGHWHDTKSDVESVSLHFHVSPYPWADAVVNTLRGRLLADAAWRSTAHSLWDSESPGWSPREALAYLRRVVRDLRPDDLAATAGATLGVLDCVRRRARSSCEVRRGPVVGPTRVAFTAEAHGNEHIAEVEMSNEYVAATLAIAKSPAGMSAATLVERVPGLTLEHALRLVQLLVDVGYARRA